jgi:Holliday junction resolvase RusA-like endonuclease
MSESIAFTVLGEPVGKARPIVTRFATYTPQATVLYENLVKTEYRRQCGDRRFPDGQPLRMEVGAYYQIPASASKKKREQMQEGTVRPMKKPDWDNVGKIISDALNGLAYRDDVQIVECRITKLYAGRPRVSVRISPVNTETEQTEMSEKEGASCRIT